MQLYKIVQTIGEGSFGTVFLIRDNTGRRLALKKIHVDPFQVDEALKEIEIMKKFEHPNLVKIYNDHFDENSEELQIVMEYCSDGDLLQYFKKKSKTLTREEILGIFGQVVKAFIVLSVKGVIHRDLKPENLLMEKGVIKVADFGCARSIGEVDMSKMGNFSLDKGTFIYASPQQLKNEKYSFKCDVWAAGCLLYFFTFGSHPFFSSKAHNTLASIRKMTQNKEIDIQKGTDPAIAKLLTLTLIYEDKQRASWREIWLSRIFHDRITNPRAFLDYLKNITHLANWIAKEFWRLRKEHPLKQNQQQIFVYFTIKLQYSFLHMALNILKKTDKYRYLFDQSSLKTFEPAEQQFNEVKKMYIEHEKYFVSIRKSMQAKEVYKKIQEIESVRTSAFLDLDKSIRNGYKILREIKETVEEGAKSRLWVVMAKWINFQRWFSFEKEPSLEKVLGEPVENVGKFVREEVEKYEAGVVE